MKDAKGHGSSGRGGASFSSASSHSMTPRLTAGFHASGKQLAPGFKTDMQRTVSDLRGRMLSTGSGHQAGLWQGIKNLMGG